MFRVIFVSVILLSLPVLIGCGGGPDGLVRSSVNLLERKQFTDAETQLRSGIARFEKKPLTEDDAESVAAAYYLLGQSLEFQGKDGAAQQVYKECLGQYEAVVTSRLSLFGIVEAHIKSGETDVAIRTLAPYSTQAEQRAAGWEPIRLGLSWPLLTPKWSQSQERARLWVLFCNYMNGNRASLKQTPNTLIDLNSGGRYAKFVEALLSQMEREKPQAEE